MSPGPTPLPLTVSPAQQAVPTALLRRSSGPQALALRVQIVLAAASGQRNAPRARQPGCSPTTARTWRARWGAAAAPLAVAAADRPALERAIAAALADAPRAGAPATFTAAQLSHSSNLACRPPDQLGRPVTAWTPRALADEAVKPGIVLRISPRSGERLSKGGRAAAPA